MKQLQGIVLKGIGGFYYVEAAGAVYECKARGIFRKAKLSPLPGDNVTITVSEQSENTIDKIEKRKNQLRRPPLANLEQLFIVSSICEPEPNRLVIDKMTAIAVKCRITPIVIFTKCDLGDCDKWIKIYRNSGISAVAVSSVTKQGIDEIGAMLKGKISAFTGNTGVGKSSLLNCLDPSLNLATSHISEKLGRGRHTTRQSELFHVCGGLVADTPGFSSFDIEKNEKIMKDELPECFPEFAEYLGQCRFSSCSHTKDKGCAIIQAVMDGKIEKSRHESYVSMYEEVKSMKEWEQ